MTTFLDLINETRLHLMTGQPDRVNVLNGNIDETSTTLIVKHDPRGITEGSRISIGLEEMHVLGVSGVTSGATVTVVRGFDGSIATPHDAGDLIRVNAQFTDYRLGRFLNQSFNAISSEGMFRVDSTNVEYSPIHTGYTLDVPGIIDVIGVSVRDRVSNWSQLHKTQYYIDHAADITDFATGSKIVLRDAVGQIGQPIRITYKIGYEQLSDLSDDVEAVSGLHPEAHDIPPLHAGITVLSGREVRRSFLHQQPEPRRQEEVPPGAAMQAIRPLMLLYERRVVNEIARLKRKWH